MDQDSVVSARSDKSGINQQQQSVLQNFSVQGPDPRQQMNYTAHVPTASTFPNEVPRNHAEMQVHGMSMVQSPIFPQPGSSVSQHPGYNSNWNAPQPPSQPFLPYTSPTIFPPQQCIGMMGWSGPPPMAGCQPSSAFPMQPLAPSSNQSYPQTQSNQPLIPLDASGVAPKLPHAHTPISSNRGGNQQMDQYGHDENAWAENATAVTGATSETGLSADNMSRFGARYGLFASLSINNSSSSCVGGAAAALIRTEIDDFPNHTCTRLFGFLIYFGLGFCSICSPVLMVIFPYLPYIGWTTDKCDHTCEGHLIGMAVKLALLGLGTWIVTAPHCPLLNGARKAYPRVRLWRSLFLCLIFVILFAFWLFYSVRILQPRRRDYGSIVLFSTSLSDALLFLNFSGIALLEFQRLRSQYAVHVVRSPDGASKTYRLGEMSLQKAALEILQMYMVDFTVYTQPLSSSSSRRNKRGGATNHGGDVGHNASSAGATGGEVGGSKYKFYDVDGREKNGAQTPGGNQTSGGGGNGPSASARVYDEMEAEKRVRKRRMRLLLAVEDAFAHAARMARETTAADGPGALNRNSVVSTGGGAGGFTAFQNGNGRAVGAGVGGTKAFDPYEAAQTVFPTLIRPLQKYLRATRQQSRHPVDSVIDHLATCITFGLSPLTFLERFNPAASTPQQDAATAANALTVARNIAQRHRRPLIIAGGAMAGSGGGAEGGVEGAEYKPPGPPVAPGGQQVWQIVADRALSRDIADGLVFQLRRQHGNCEISLLCTVHRLPLLQLLEAGVVILVNVRCVPLLVTAVGAWVKCLNVASHAWAMVPYEVNTTTAAAKLI
ncbi:Vang-like protein [Echinococcus granulosus]|uniref:Vang-like protein n=1 Tax=Echinococcus granulosus TaxID=6210 RepID=W6UQ87_ECHGR|nr:Vang-like protein [Echinococcus granulosus]EUB63403.1 Vang-like protein [Echinococcus granulosus]